MNGTVLDRFDRSARAAPDAVALTGDGRSVTYAELEGDSRRIADLLRARGVGADDRVAVSLERSPRVVAAILGVLRAGAAYVPLDPANPDARLHMIMADARPALLLTEQALVPRFPGETEVVELDAPGVLDGATTPGPAAPPTDGPSPEGLAYVIYTSGTTGVPKGVMVTHGNVDSLLAATEPIFGFGPSDVWTLFHSYGFDFSVWEMWGALAYGGRLVVPSADVVRSPDAFYELLHREGVTVLCQTPSAFATLTDLEERGGSRPLALRHVIFGGEELDARRLAPWFDRHGDEVPELANMYGITETTVHTTYHRLTRADVGSGVRSPIGAALPHLRIRLLDDAGLPVADGTVGELYVSGDGVAQGYLDRPDLTGERFVQVDGARAYRSGDLACRLPDGGLDYRGRVDAQVQVRGFRVELGEIESVLRDRSVVADAVVAYRTDRPGGRLVAYVVPRAGGLGVEVERGLRQALADRLPSYMIPSDYVAIDAVPLTPNGKVDRAALPEPPVSAADARDAAGQGGGAPDATDGSGTLGRLARIWAEFLSVDRLTAGTDFFEAGGHSLLAVEVMIRARQEFGVDIPLGTMFEHTTLEDVARRIDELTSGTEEFVL